MAISLVEHIGGTGLDGERAAVSASLTLAWVMSRMCGLPVCGS
jgi:hypothetical protein